jgi:hypothetical protein
VVNLGSKYLLPLVPSSSAPTTPFVVVVINVKKATREGGRIRDVGIAVVASSSAVHASAVSAFITSPLVQHTVRLGS